jgi:hypothetical protein
MISVDRVEANFMLQRLRDVSRVADHILHDLPYSQFRPKWDDRHLVTAKIIEIGNRFDHHLQAMVFNELAATIVEDAITNNPYFQRLPADSPKRAAANIKKVNDLAVRVGNLLGRYVKPPKTTAMSGPHVPHQAVNRDPGSPPKTRTGPARPLADHLAAALEARQLVFPEETSATLTSPMLV